MRFENWDVLLFPQVSGTPIQEFRTECFSVATLLWSPKLVRGHEVVIAMHVAIDGKTVAVQKVDPDGSFPHQVFNSPVTRTIFPPFHKAIRSQLQLHVADNLGRITVGLSEGYFYEANGTHFNPINDLVTFKWIHAPQNLLRTAGIAWPNAAPFVKLPQDTDYNHVPHMSCPTGAVSSRSTFPPFPDQLLTDTSHIDLNDLTLSSEFSSDYTFGVPLPESLPALHPI
ncbi:hypothetical protein E4T45_03786 [Aureobasidium sp. EXF-8846]|nr:hypothetical protein E4T45_03786 [Aureobasidium sp. EXF-8846]